MADPLIFTYVPYCPAHIDGGVGFGSAINEFMSLLRDDDWAFISEHDALPTTPDWFRRLEHHASMHPDAILMPLRHWTGKATARVFAPPEAKGPEVIMDFAEHMRLGRAVARRGPAEATPIPDSYRAPIPALWLLKKSTWSRVGGFKSGWDETDIEFGTRARERGVPILIMQDVYIAHFKRKLR